MRVRQAFEGFIGNAPVIERIGIDLISALVEMPPHLSKNYLLTGQPSTGKTELAKRVANALGLPFVRLDGRGLTSRERLFELIDGALRQHGLAASQIGTAAGLPEMEYPAFTVFIDEAHLTPRPVQESLLTMLEAADRTVTLQSRIAQINRTTFLFATTRKSELDPALRSRCSIVELREYETSEVAEIVRLSCPEDWPAETYLAIAQLGRSVPRIAIDLAQELKRRISVAEQRKQPHEHLDDVRRSRELDERGLSRLDIRYLELLQGADRALGERALLNMLGTVDPETVLNEVEPFLRRLDLIRLGRQGREITNNGRNYVLDQRRRAAT
jgi:Holliday junction resolvasome RuvABC ATP-dependent DNA helicase subunit